MDFFQESYPLREKKEKINKLVSTLVEDQALFKKFKSKRQTVERVQMRLKPAVLDP
jgi:hypothetical protein